MAVSVEQWGDFFRLDNSSYCQIRERWSLLLHQFRRSCALVWWIWVGHSGMCCVCVWTFANCRWTSSHNEISCLPDICLAQVNALVFALLWKVLLQGACIAPPLRDSNDCAGETEREQEWTRYTDIQNDIQHHTILGKVVRSLPHLILETSHCKCTICNGMKCGISYISSAKWPLKGPMPRDHRFKVTSTHWLPEFDLNPYQLFNHPVSMSPDSCYQGDF